MIMSDSEEWQSDLPTAYIPGKRKKILVAEILE
jgi:hypothetical protein